jgi:hypothetical protein
MLVEAVKILATALLSSAVTLWLVAFYFRRYLLPQVERDFQQVIDRAIEEMGRTIEERVKKGVLDGVASIPSAEMLQSTTRAAAQTGVDLVGAGINALLGGGRRDRK